MLPFETFKQIVQHTPLISIDLIIENNKGEILLGWRSNQPAQGYWFVPGGRINKDEKYADAFRRIVKSETGLEYALEDAAFLGVYEHLYPNDNFAGESGFGTHYIVNGYRIKLERSIDNLPKDQHTDYWWAPLDDLLEDNNVHINTKNYFNGFPPFSE